jgi:hypothetical protein
MVLTKFVFDCIKEMFKRVGAEYSEEFVKDPHWYQKYQWTEAEEDDFKKWLIAEMRKKMRWTKGSAEKEAAWFMLMWGWSNLPAKEGE